jgi:hypothetical protein
LLSENTKSCPFCGYTVEDDDAFCYSCGASLTEKVEAVANIPVIAQQTPKVDYPQYTQPVIMDEPRERKNVVAILSVIFGGLAVAASLIPFAWCLMFLLSPIAFILGMIGVFIKRRRYLAGIGIGLALLGVLFYLLQFVFYVLYIPYF